MGGVHHVTSVATLRSRPSSMLYVMFSGRYNIETEEGSGVFLDRDGYVFGHVLAYLRDGVVAAGCERDVSMLERVRREFDFFRLEVLEERTVVLAVGGVTTDNVAVSSVNAYDDEKRRWQTSAPMLQRRSGFGMCVIAGELYVTEETTTITIILQRWSGTAHRATLGARWLRCRKPDLDTRHVKSAG